MKKLFLLKLGAIIFAFAITHKLSAQDNWVNVAETGLGNSDNDAFKSPHVFNGKIYIGAGSQAGYVYSSSTGDPGSWTMVFSEPGSYNVGAISSTTLGGGNLYVSSYKGCCDTSRVWRSTDGVSWMPYFSSTNNMEITKIVPFKGAGTNDSIYLIENNSNGSIIYKSYYNSSDPLNLSGSTWDTVFDFSPIVSGRNISSATVHNGKMYFGTDGTATLWSSADGNTWTQNMDAGDGFGDTDNMTITSMASFGGYLYVGTYNYTGGQIWRSNDDVSWTMVKQFSPSYTTVSSLNVAAGQLWITIGAEEDPGQIWKSTDGTTYTISNPDGFGTYRNNGNAAAIIEFGNNIYWTGENYYEPVKRQRAIDDYGAQIWRLCKTTPPALELGPDQAICDGTSVTLDAGPGAISYTWNTEDHSQTISAFSGHVYQVDIVGANGCSASDRVKIALIEAPSVIPPNIPPTVCSGNTVPLFPLATSNVYNPDPPIHKTTNKFVSDFGGDVYDSIMVTGANGNCACTALLSVTIDSLYHTFSGDLALEIFAPNGSSILLSDHRGGENTNSYVGTEFTMSGDNSIGSASHPFSGSYVPETSFSFLSGSPNGNWVLRVADTQGGDEGYLKGWSIRFRTSDSIMTFSWSPGTGLSSTTTLNTIATPLETTNYVLTTTNSAGCSSETSMNIFVPAVGASIPASDTTCFGMSYFMDGGTFNTHWSPATGLSDTIGQYILATVTAPITYYMTDTVGGCILSDSVHLVQNPSLSFTPPPSQTACFGDTVAFTSIVSGGTTPYTYIFGTTPDSNPTHYMPVYTNMTYSVSVRDAAGCYSFGSTSATVIPSTDIYGTITYSGGAVASSNVVLYQYEPYLTHFDTLQVTTTDASGNYHFSAINHNEYLIEVFPDAAYPTLVPTYYGDVFLWDSATVVMHGCDLNDTLNIISVEQVVLSGPGSLSGTVFEDEGFGRVPGDPVPGIDVKLGRNPGGQMMASTVTGPDGSPTDGQYSFSNLPLNAPGEWYTIYVDIPGLGRDSSYNITLDATNNEYLNLDYYVDSTVIYITNDVETHIAASQANEHLLSVYPNPSKGNSTVEYSINNDAKVSLGVYNVLGVKVFELVNTEQTAGIYKYNINAKNNALNSGVYFVTLLIDGKASIKRLVITE